MNINFDTTDKLLKTELLKASTAELADIFTDHAHNRKRIFFLLGVAKFSSIFIYLDEDIQKKFLDSLVKKEKQQLLNKLSLNDLKDVFELYTHEEQLELLKLIEKKNSLALVKLLSYNEDSAGAFSSPHFVCLPTTLTIKEATYQTIAYSGESDEIDVIFFKDEHDKFAGACTIRDLITARANQPLSNIIDDKFPFVYESDRLPKALKMIRHYDLLMLPVLNQNEEVIGFISETDTLTLMEEEHSKMIRSMVKVAENNDDLNAGRRALTRLPWLLISVILNLVIAAGLSTFTDLLDTFVVLVLFQPMILGMAGNIGTQSMGVTILGLHRQKISMKKHFARELGIGAVNSVLSGIFGFVVVYGFLLLTKNPQAFIVGVVVGIALVFAMMISALAGVLTPIVLKALKFDEKAASGPLISTINDFFALQSYFLVATLLLVTLKL